MQIQIRKLRIKAGLTQNNLAEKMGYKSQSIANMWETGERKVPSDKIPQLANVLGCEINDLFDSEETYESKGRGEASEQLRKNGNFKARQTHDEQ